MAAYGPACDRIRFLMGLSSHRAYSPATINGSEERVKSYALTIGLKRDDGTWMALQPTSTPTTNRHIRALHMVLEGQGYKPIASDDRCVIYA